MLSQKKGEVIKDSDIVELRPALGILPKYKNVVVGKIAKNNIQADSPINWSDF